MLMRSLLSYGCLIFALSGAHSATAASFDCAKAKSPVEKAICSDAELSKLDEELARAYKAAVQDYPVVDYVRTRQREWLKDNSNCEKGKLVGCLKERYHPQIKQLLDAKKRKIYASDTRFSFDSGDAVAEVWQDGTRYLISIWGGFRIHREASKGSGRPVYTGCEFEGAFTSPSGGKAVNQRGQAFTFKIVGKEITYESDQQICEGFGSLPESLTLIEK